MDQILTILFDSHGQEFESRLSELRQDTESSAAELQDAIATRLEEIESAQQDQIAVAEAKDKRLKQRLLKLEKIVAKLDRKLEQSEQRLRKIVSTQSDRCERKNSQQDKITQRIEDESRKLQETKLDQAAVHRMLRDLALGLDTE